MNIKISLALKCFTLLFGLTVYNFLYENYINEAILMNYKAIIKHFQNSTTTLPNT